MCVDVHTHTADNTKLYHIDATSPLQIRGNTVDLPQLVRETQSSLFSPPPLLLQRIMSIAKVTGVITPPLNKINDAPTQQLRIFITPTLSAMSWGSIAVGEAAIGVPRTFLCTDVHDPILQTLSVGHQTQVSQAVKQVLLPSTQSQDFSIAHELGHIHHEDGFKSALIDPVVIVGGYTFARRLASATNLRASQKAVSLTLLLPMMGVVRASAKWIQELRADSFAATHGFGDGGSEFLLKRLELNRMMRGGDESASLMSLLTHPPPRFRLWCIQTFHS
eukprot:m.161204 g.161204  ORF g.161204 m.161204 type:complete len:277 (+) comp31218_c0_seq2:125-955(+)